MKSFFKSSSASNTKLSGWGVFWRAAGMAVLLIAFVAAVCLGLHYGAAYIVGLGLSEVATTALGYLLTFASYFGIAYSTLFTIGKFEDLFARKAPAAAPAQSAAAAPAAAAA